MQYGVTLRMTEKRTPVATKLRGINQVNSIALSNQKILEVGDDGPQANFPVSVVETVH